MELIVSEGIRVHDHHGEEHGSSMADRYGTGIVAESSLITSM